MKRKILSPAIIPLIIAGVFLVGSCSTSKETPCPDFSNNRSYSRKYQAHHKVNRNQLKYLSSRKSVILEFQIPEITRRVNEYSADFTINQNPSAEFGYFKLKPAWSITSEQVQFPEKKR